MQKQLFDGLLGQPVKRCEIFACVTLEFLEDYKFLKTLNLPMQISDCNHKNVINQYLYNCKLAINKF